MMNDVMVAGSAEHGDVSAAAAGETVSAAITSPTRNEQLMTFFRHPEYLAAIGGQLNSSNVMDYFRYSNYYDPTCNNAILQMQNTANLNDMMNNWSPGRLEEELKRFVGIEYVLVHAKPPDLFVIHQRWRSSPTETKVLECYYVHQGNIHMAADLYSILGSKVLTAISALSSSLSLVRETQSTFNPREGHAWRVAAEDENSSEDDDDDDDGDEVEESKGRDAAQASPFAAFPVSAQDT